VPPHSIEAEQAVLGGLMLDNNAWERCWIKSRTAISIGMTTA
jgi:replicative DNA helicase